MNKLVSFVKETRNNIWKDENVKRMADIFEQQAESAFTEFFRHKHLIAASCRVFGIVVKDIENEIFTFGEIIADVDTYKTEEEAEEGFITLAEDYNVIDLDRPMGTFNWNASTKGLHPFIEELKSRGYKVLNDDSAKSLLIYFIVSE